MHQERLNESLRLINAGRRKSNVISLDDDKRHADFTNKECKRRHEGLKLLRHPNLRRGAVGHAAVSPFAALAHDTLREKMVKLQLTVACD